MLLVLASQAGADITAHLNIKADCGGCQSFEQFPRAVQAFGESFLRTTKRLDLPAQTPEIVITAFKPRSLGSRMTWGVVGGKDEMAAEMRVDGMVFKAQETARTSLIGFEGVAENLAEQLADSWSARLGATRSVTFSSMYAPAKPAPVQAVSSSSGVRVVTPEQAAMAKAMGIKLE